MNPAMLLQTSNLALHVVHRVPNIGDSRKLEVRSFARRIGAILYSVADH